MNRVLVPVDGSESSLGAVRSAIASVRAGTVESVCLVNVQPPLPRYVSRWIARDDRDGFRLDRGRRELRRARGLLDDAGVSYTSEVVIGEEAVAIAAEAARLQCTEIVIGVSRANVVDRFLDNGLQSRLLDATAVPLRVVPGRSRRAMKRIAIPIGLGLGMGLVLFISE